MKDLNELAKKVAESEGLRYQISIGQIKEVLKITATELAGDIELTCAFLMNGHNHLNPKEKKPRKSRKVYPDAEEKPVENESPASPTV